MYINIKIKSHQPILVWWLFVWFWWDNPTVSPIELFVSIYVSIPVHLGKQAFTTGSHIHWSVIFTDCYMVVYFNFVTAFRLIFPGWHRCIPEFFLIPTYFFVTQVGISWVRPAYGECSFIWATRLWPTHQVLWYNLMVLVIHFWSNKQMIHASRQKHRSSIWYWSPGMGTGPA